jgi:hypothetical protein
MSLYFDGDVNSYLSLTNVDGLDFGTGDFTIEWWMYETENKPFPRVFQIGSYPSISISIGVSVEGGAFYLWSGGSGNYIGNSEYDTWIHYAISRYSGVTKIYKNSVEVGNIADTTNYVSGLDLLIGNETNRSSGAAYTGYIVGFSWSKGIARYTSDFTPPLRFPAVDTYTQFILGGSGGVGGPLAGSIVNSNVLVDQTLLPDGYSFEPEPEPEPVVSNPFEQPLRRQCCRRLVFGVDEKKTEKKGYTRTLTSNYGTLGRRRR